MEGLTTPLNYYVSWTHDSVSQTHTSWKHIGRVHTPHSPKINLYKGLIIVKTVYSMLEQSVHPQNLLISHLRWIQTLVSTQVLFLWHSENSQTKFSCSFGLSRQGRKWNYLVRSSPWERLSSSKRGKQQPTAKRSLNLRIHLTFCVYWQRTDRFNLPTRHNVQTYRCGNVIS